jgi:hypothetical protein
MGVGGAPLFHDDFYVKRGRRCRVYDLFCRSCGQYVSKYQKDGPYGSLRRLYADRFEPKILVSQSLWGCEKCGKNLGYRIDYDKEPREAYQLFVDAITPKGIGGILRIMNWFGRY